MGLVRTSFTCLCDTKRQIKIKMPSKHTPTIVKFLCWACESTWLLTYHKDGPLGMRPIYSSPQMARYVEKKQKIREMNGQANN